MPICQLFFPITLSSRRTNWSSRTLWYSAQRFTWKITGKSSSAWLHTCISWRGASFSLDMIVASISVCFIIRVTPLSTWWASFISCGRIRGHWSWLGVKLVRGRGPLEVGMRRSIPFMVTCRRFRYFKLLAPGWSRFKVSFLSISVLWAELGVVHIATARGREIRLAPWSTKAQGWRAWLHGGCLWPVDSEPLIDVLEVGGVPVVVRWENRRWHGIGWKLRIWQGCRGNSSRWLRRRWSGSQGRIQFSIAFDGFAWRGPWSWAWPSSVDTINSSIG